MSATSSATTLDSGPKTLRLHVWGSSTTLPTLDPTSLYAASLLGATFARNASVQLQLASASTSLPRVPLLQVLDDNDHTVQLIDNVDDIRTFCAAAGLDSALRTDAELEAKQTALHALIDDQLLDLTLHSLFSLPANFRAVTAPAYSSVGGAEVATSTIAKLATLPARFQPSIPSRLRNVVETRLTAVGLWGMGGKEANAKTGEADELAARAGIVPARKKGLGQSAKEAVKDQFERSKLVTKWREGLDVLDAALAQQVLAAERAGSLDAHVFGTLAPLVFASPPLPVDTLPRLIRASYPRLSAYLEMLKEQLLPETPRWATQAHLAATPPVLGDASSATCSILSYFWPFAPTQKASPAPTPRPSSPPTDGKRKPTPAPSAAPEDRRLRLGRALWICSALVGLIGYTFASGIVSVQFVDGDDLEEDGEEEDQVDDEDDDEEEEEDEDEDGEGWEEQSDDDLDELDDDPPSQLAHHDPSTSCSSPPTLPFTSSASPPPTCPTTHHLVTGTFNSPSLFVLTYDALHSTLHITHTIAAQGPHQYLALGVAATGQQTVYATTWAAESTLSAWHIGSDYSLSLRNSRAITATGSYVHVQPPPYSTLSGPGFGSAPGVARWLGSAGGPTGELHRLEADGAIGERVKELVFLPGGEAELRTADKTRKALRYGAHSFDCSPSDLGGETEGQVAYIADLGANAVQAYTFPQLEHLYTIPSKRSDDGPRHAIPHPHRPLVFTVTEHSNYVDVYQVPRYGAAGPTRHVAHADMLLATERRSDFRGDTLRFSSDLRYLYASTRGKTAATTGRVVAYRLHITDLHVQLDEVARYTTRTSGGKANAIELSPRPIKDGLDLMVLTDDEQGFVDILAFDLEKQEFAVQATAQLPALETEAQGASHAIWLL